MNFDEPSLYMKQFNLLQIGLFGLALVLSWSSRAQSIPTVAQFTQAIVAIEDEQKNENWLDSIYQQFAFAPETATLSSIYYHLGYRYRFFPNYQKATQSLEKAIYHAAGNALYAGKAYWKLGETLMEMNQLDSAITCLQIARNHLEQQSTTDHQKYLIRTLSDLGNIYEEKGDYERANHLITAAFDHYERKQDTFYMAYALNRLGIISYRQNQNEVALAHLNKAEQFYQKLKQSNQLGETIFLYDVILNKGNAFKAKEDYKNALIQYQRVIDQLPPTEDNAIIARINKGMTLQLNGKYDQAIALYQAALKIQQEVLDTNYSWFELTSIYDNLGDAYQSKREYSLAISNYQMAIRQHVPALRSKEQDLSNPNLETMQLVGSKRNVLVPLNSKARTFRLLFHQTGDRNYLTKSLTTYQLIDQLVDLMRFEQKDDGSKLYWRQTVHPIYGEALETAYLLEDMEAALYFMEKSKSVLLADALSDRQALAQTQIPEQLLDQINALKKSVFEAQQQPNQRMDYLRLKKELENSITSLEQSYPSYYQFKYNLKVPDITQLRHRLLNDSTAFIAYFMGDSSMFSLQITKTDIQLSKLEFTSTELKQWKEMLQLATNSNLFNTKKKDQFLAYNKALTHRLWTPLDPAIKRYIIAPDGWLNYLNFELLVTDYSKEKIDYLILKNTFSYTWSATVSQYVLPAKQQAEKRFLGIAPKEFPTYPDLELLENSIEEITTIQNTVGGQLLMKEDATQDALIQALAKDYQMVHFATHAQANNQEPFIALFDQKIPLTQIYKLNFSKTEMVVLSACESSVGEWQVGEGVASLARGCLFAGAQSVIASQWAVNDQSTARLMRDFYTQLGQKLPKDQALRRAKLNRLQQDPSPANWAAFITIGNPKPLKLVKPDGLSFWYGVSVFALMLGIFFYIKRR